MSDITALTAIILQRRITELQDDLRRVTAERDHARSLAVALEQLLSDGADYTKVVTIGRGPGAAA